jgi:hypothetical protein
MCPDVRNPCTVCGCDCNRTSNPLSIFAIIVCDGCDKNFHPHCVGQTEEPKAALKWYENFFILSCLLFCWFALRSYNCECRRFCRREGCPSFFQSVAKAQPILQPSAPPSSSPLQILSAAATAAVAASSVSDMENDGDEDQDSDDENKKNAPAFAAALMALDAASAAAASVNAVAVRRMQAQTPPLSQQQELKERQVAVPETAAVVAVVPAAAVPAVIPAVGGVTPVQALLPLFQAAWRSTAMPSLQPPSRATQPLSVTEIEASLPQSCDVGQDSALRRRLLHESLCSQLPTASSVSASSAAEAIPAILVQPPTLPILTDAFSVANVPFTVTVPAAADTTAFAPFDIVVPAITRQPALSSSSSSASSSSSSSSAQRSIAGLPSLPVSAHSSPTVGAILPSPTFLHQLNHDPIDDQDPLSARVEDVQEADVEGSF